MSAFKVDGYSFDLANDSEARVTVSHEPEGIDGPTVLLMVEDLDEHFTGTGLCTTQEANAIANALTDGRLAALVREVRRMQKRIEARCDDPRDDDLVRDLDTAVLAFRGEFEP